MKVKKILQTPSIKFVGHLAAPTGLGQSARHTVVTLENAGIDVHVESVRTPDDSPEFLQWVEERRSPSRHIDSHVFVLIPGEFWFSELFYQGRVDIRTQHVTAIWPWEIEEVPAFFKKTLQYADQIFALSDFSANALTEKLGREVTSFPTIGDSISQFPISRPSEFEAECLRNLNLPTSYLLCRFDAKSLVKRKNPEAVLDVWETINSHYPNVHLIIKTSGFNSRANLKLLDRISKIPRVIVIDRNLPNDANVELMRNALVAISLHRAEGLGLNILEAVDLDVPSIFTAFSGITHELSPIGFPVKYSTSVIGPGVAPYPDYGRWAEADIPDAVEQTKRALDLVLSGEWQAKSGERKAWVDNFYRQANATTVEMARATLAVQKIPMSTSKRAAISLLITLNRIWRRTPIGIRRLMYKYVQPLYRKLLL